MRYVERSDILTIVRENPDLTAHQVALKAYPDIWPESSNFRTAKIRVYSQLQDLKRNGQVIISGTIRSPKVASTWRAVE